MIWFFEFLYGVGLFSIGLLFLNVCAPRASHWLKVGMAFPAGFAIYALLTLLLLALKFPITLMSIGLGFLMMCLGLIFVLRRGQVVRSVHLLPMFASGSALIALVTLFSSYFKFLILSYDSYTYAVLSGNVMLVEGGLTAPAISGFITSYSAMVPFGNSAAGLWGRDFVSISPLLFAVSILSIVYASIFSFTKELIHSKTLRHGLAASSALLILSAPQFMFHSFYFMPNLPMATFVLCVFAIFWEFVRSDDSGWYIPLALFLIAAGMCRLEGGLFVIFMALSFTAVQVKNPRQRTSAYLVACMFLSVWLLYLSSINPNKEGGILSTNAAIAQGLLLMAPVIAAGLSIHPFMRKLIRIGVVAMPIALFLAGLLLFAQDAEHGRANLLNWTLNTTSRVGLWAWAWMGLAGIFAACAVFGRSIKGSAFIVCSLLSLLILTFDLGLFREFPYRLGAQDSGNRLMLQIFPSFVLAASIWIANSIGRPEDHSPLKP